MTEGRTAARERSTSETRVAVALDLDGGPVTVGTGIPFFDHMLNQLARHSRIGLTLEADGALEIDAHHTVEDCGIVLGEALQDALGDKTGIRRYGDALVRMEEAVAQVALDISGRARLVYRVELPLESIGTYDTDLTEEFLQALCRSAGLSLHVRLLEGSNAHHCVEAIFKAVARALGEAVAIDPRATGEIPSTKGVL